MKFFSREVKIALVAIVAIVIVYFGIMFLKGISLNKTDNMYYVEMSDVSGLPAAAEVLASGVKVGMVKQLSYNPDKQNVAFSVEFMDGFKVPKGTTATLTKDMLGAPKVKIILGSSANGYMAKGDTIPGFPLADLMETATDLVPSFQALLPKVDSILMALNNLANDPALSHSLHNIDYVTTNLRTTSDQLNLLMQRDIPKMMANVNTVSDNLATTTGNLKEVDFMSIANNANQTISELQLFTNRLNNENSTLGKLTNDASVYNHLDSTMQNASLLLKDLRENPKRYVHFSMFGKKDK